METVAYIVLWVVIIVGGCIILQGAATVAEWLGWRYSWKRGKRLQMAKSVMLGWNTGEMPDRSWFIVREDINDLPTKEEIESNPYYRENIRHALLRRIGSRAYSINGSYSTPITNITGWMEVTLPEKIEE